MTVTYPQLWWVSNRSMDSLAIDCQYARIDHCFETTDGTSHKQVYQPHILQSIDALQCSMPELIETPRATRIPAGVNL